MFSSYELWASTDRFFFKHIAHKVPWHTGVILKSNSAAAPIALWFLDWSIRLQVWTKKAHVWELQILEVLVRDVQCPKNLKMFEKQANAASLPWTKANKQNLTQPTENEPEE